MNTIMSKRVVFCGGIMVYCSCSLTAQPYRIDPPPHIGCIGIDIFPAGKADGVLAYEKAAGRVKVPVAVVAQAGFLVVVLALQAKRFGPLRRSEVFKTAQGIVGGRPDDGAAGVGQLLGQAVGIVVIRVDLIAAGNLLLMGQHAYLLILSGIEER
jgi:hypothetical protein